MRKMMFAAVLTLLAALVFTGCANVEQAVAEMNGQILSNANSSSSQEQNPKTNEENTPAGGYTEEQLRPLVEDLLTQGKEIYNLFFGTGLPVEETDPIPDTNFVPVISDRFLTIEDLQAYTESVFTKSVASSVFYSACIENEYPVYKMLDGQLCRNMDVEGANFKGQWLTDTLKIQGQAENTIKIFIDFKGITGKTVQKELTLVKEEDQWKLDSPLTE